MFKSSDERNKAKGIKKLTADHAEFGVYMGPCEASPAQVVYLPARNRMVTAAHCLFNEDSLPGTHNIQSTDWGPILDRAVADGSADPSPSSDAPLLPRATGGDEPSPDELSPPPAPPTIPPPPVPARSSESATVPASEGDNRPTRLPPPPAPARDSAATLPAPQATASSTLGDPSSPIDATPDGQVEESDDDSDAALDGSYWAPPVRATQGIDGRPKRATNQRQGSFSYDEGVAPITKRPPASASQRARAAGYSCGFGALVHNPTHPGSAPSHTAILLAAASCRPTFAYLSCVAAAALPQPSLSINDVRVPKGYRQAMEDVRAAYWREAIHQEWTGILEKDTLDFVKRRSMPPGANLMNSVWPQTEPPRMVDPIDRGALGLRVHSEHH